jgi:glycosyltransferase involved in cell wall biosynthesis
LPSNRIKVLFIIPTLEIGGGAEKNAYNLGNKFKVRYDIRYLNFYNKTRVYDTGQFVYNLNEKSNKNLISKLLYIFKRLIFLRKVCNEFKPDLVISFGFYSNILVSICSLFRTYRVILSVRSDLKRKGRLIRYLSTALYNRMDVTHVLTKKMDKDLSSLGIKNTFHIYNGHNVEGYRSMASDDLPTKIPNEAYVYLNIGRLNYAKGQWHLLKAFSVCVEQYPNSMLIIIGEGELKNELEALIDALQIKDKVLMLDNKLNIFPYIKRANCCCFSSLFEGLPNVLIETLAIQTPVITTDCISGPREIVFPQLDVDESVSYPFHANCGILTAPFTSVGFDTSINVTHSERNFALAMGAVRSLASQDSDYESRVLAFSEDKIIDQWYQLIDRLCTRQG